MKPVAYLSYTLFCTVFTGCGIEGKSPNEPTKCALKARPERMIEGFTWQLLEDTNSYFVQYIALPRVNKIDSNRKNKEIIDFVEAQHVMKYELTNTEEYFLLHLLTDSNSFEQGDCGTFWLEGGFVFYKNEQLTAYINLGCGYSQWLFHPENKLTRTGNLNEHGFWKIQALLDNINKRKSEQP